MKKILTLFSIILILASCKKEEIEQVTIDKLSTSCWYFSTSSETGRGIVFVFSGGESKKRKYELVFDLNVSNQDIIIELIGIEDMGEHPKFPGNEPHLSPSGSIFIPEHLLPAGDYNFILRTDRFEVQSSFSFDDSKYTLSIPLNPHFFSNTKEEYPMPANILFGSIGGENIHIGRDFLNELNANGFTNTIVPNYEKIPRLSMQFVDSNGLPIESTYPSGSYHITFVCQMDNNFRAVFDIASRYFNEYDFNAYMFSSNGDQASMSKLDGISSVFVD